jgi:hypothetical protein
MYKILLLTLSLFLFSCNSSDPADPGGDGGVVVNLEDINKLRKELSNSWESWKPESRNQRDIVTHIGGEVEEGSEEYGPVCHYIYDSIKYTTTWNREADTFDLSRELINYTLGSRTSEDESICHLRANQSTLGDSLGLSLGAIVFLHLDEIGRTDSEFDEVPFDEIKPVSMVKRVKNGVKLWDLKYFIRGTYQDFNSLNLKSIAKFKNLNSNTSFSGFLTVTFASEVPFTAWIVKSGYVFNLSNGTSVAGEELQVTSFNNSPID